METISVKRSIFIMSMRPKVLLTNWCHLSIRVHVRYAPVNTRVIMQETPRMRSAFGMPPRSFVGFTKVWIEDCTKEYDGRKEVHVANSKPKRFVKRCLE